MSAAAVIIIRVKRVFAFLRNRSALSRETAIPIQDVPYSNRWYFRRLIRRGAVQVDGEKCYLDESKARLYLQNFRLRALVFLALVLIFFVFYMVVKSIN